MLFVTNNEIRNSIRERFIADPSTEPLSKNLFIDSQRESSEFIVQSNYNLSMSEEQSVRVGFERAITELDSALFIASPFGIEPASDQYGGLSLLASASNAGTSVKETRYEGFAFHNWTINDKSSLESSVVSELRYITEDSFDCESPLSIKKRSRSRKQVI